MPLQYKGAAVTAVKYNGQNVTKVYYKKDGTSTKVLVFSSDGSGEESTEEVTVAPSTGGGGSTTPPPSTGGGGSTTPTPTVAPLNTGGGWADWITVSGSTVALSGWAYMSDSSHTTIKVARSVRLRITGANNFVKWTDATLGGSRPDVPLVFPDLPVPGNLGWTITYTLPAGRPANGKYNLNVFCYAEVGVTELSYAPGANHTNVTIG